MFSPVFERLACAAGAGVCKLVINAPETLSRLAAKTTEAAASALETAANTAQTISASALFESDPPPIIFLW
jgi:hypothetical protein